MSIKNFIRVDHAGEYGAVRIYTGQLAVLGRGKHGDQLRHMKDQELHHLDTFAKLIAERHGRPTALLPLWHVAGFALGAITAAIGPEAAMACTVAVEETIDAHYAAQRDRLGDDEKPLRDTIEEFRLEEVEHRDIGLQNGAERAPAYRVLHKLISLGCKAAIGISEII
jgi:ubiquinone biosynthesis monooxygenase Coq7